MESPNHTGKKVSIWSSLVRRPTVDAKSRSSTFPNSPQNGSKEFFTKVFQDLVAREMKEKGNHDSDNMTEDLILIDSFGCSYCPRYPDNDASPAVRGYMFCTRKTMYFIGSGDKIIRLDWNSVDRISKLYEESNAVPDCIEIFYPRNSASVSSYLFGELKRRDRIFRSLQSFVSDATTSRKPMDTSKSCIRVRERRSQTEDSKGSVKVDDSHEKNLSSHKRRLSKNSLVSYESTANDHVRNVPCHIEMNGSEMPPSNNVKCSLRESWPSSPSLSKEAQNNEVEEVGNRRRAFSEPTWLHPNTQSLDDYQMGFDYSEYSTSDDTSQVGADSSRKRSDTLPILSRDQQRNLRLRTQTAPVLNSIVPSTETLPEELLSSNQNAMLIRGESSCLMREVNRRSSMKKVKSRKRNKLKKTSQHENDSKEVQSMTPKAESNLFKNSFSHHFGKGQNVDSLPKIVTTYSCAYWPRREERHVAPLLHGRMFCTSTTMYFVGWGGKKIILPWSDATKLKRESTAWGAVPNAIRIFYKYSHGDECSYLFGSFINREGSFTMLQKFIDYTRSFAEPVAEKQVERSVRHQILPEVPADQLLPNMVLMSDERLKNVSIKEFYSKCWADHLNTANSSFYCNFLKSQPKNFSVTVGKWEFPVDETVEFSHEWSQEKFTQKRKVSYDFKRSTHLYIGPPVATVNETQYCRIENDDKLVIAISVNINGIPYGDCFTIEIRWVARRERTYLRVQVGLFIDFKKRVIIAPKIRSSITEEMKPITEAHVELCRRSCEPLGTEMDSGDISDATSTRGEARQLPHESTSQRIMRSATRCVFCNVDTLFHELKIIINKLGNESAAFKLLATTLCLNALWSIVLSRMSGGRSLQAVDPIGTTAFDDLAAEVRLLRSEVKELTVMLQGNVP